MRKLMNEMMTRINYEAITLAALVLSVAVVGFSLWHAFTHM